MKQIRRRLLLFASGALLAPPFARSQQPGRIYRIGVLGTTSPRPGGLESDALRQRLRERGWVEGSNVAYEYRWAEGKSDRFPQFAKELVSLKADVIIAPSEDAALAAKAATQTIPIVTIYPSDPVRLGLIKSYARPGGNITGLTYEAEPQSMHGKPLELLKEAIPGLSRVAVLWNPSSAQSERWLKDMQAPAGVLRLELLPFGARTAEEIEPAFTRMNGSRAGALVILADPMFFPHRLRLAELALHNRLPALSALYTFPEVGGLMTYQVDLPHLFARATDYVDRILKGTKPADLPVELPKKFEFVINLKTAKALGIRIPQSVLVRADRVIE